MLKIDSWWAFVVDGANATIIAWNHPNVSTTRFPWKEDQRNHRKFWKWTWYPSKKYGWLEKKVKKLDETCGWTWGTSPLQGTYECLYMSFALSILQNPLNHANIHVVTLCVLSGTTNKTIIVSIYSWSIL
jgi:hypothetical protein